MTVFGLSKLFRGAQLTPLERRVVGVVSAQLGTDARQLFEAQVNPINKIQRHSSGKEVNLYAMRRGKPSIEERFLFPLRTETLLAKVQLNLGQEKLPLRAEVWLVNGHVFSIHFNKPPAETPETEIHVANVEILHDPMIAASAGPTSDADRREILLRNIQSKLPDEYLQLVGDGNGLSINDWAVYELQDVRKVVQRDANYYLLAEKEGAGAVAVKEDELSGRIYYLDYGDDRAEKISVGLQKFFAEFDGGKIAGRF
ncbi:MAG TPA: hypothetical protein VMZ30_16945 [Pyrinomonadaceae bacterium]|nr:hypothetical protein [Pyrinomonadaceae bacterium]